MNFSIINTIRLDEDLKIINTIRLDEDLKIINIIKKSDAINVFNITDSSSRLKVIKCDIVYPSPAEYIDIEPEFIWLSSIEDSMAQFNVYSNTDWIVE